MSNHFEKKNAENIFLVEFEKQKMVRTTIVWRSYAASPSAQLLARATFGSWPKKKQNRIRLKFRSSTIDESLADERKRRSAGSHSSLSRRRSLVSTLSSTAPRLPLEYKRVYLVISVSGENNVPFAGSTPPLLERIQSRKKITKCKFHIVCATS